MNGAVELFGAPYSVYVRICRIALAEKGVGYKLHPVDVFAEAGPGAEYMEMNPFGRIPALRHGSFELYETDAITAYINDAFEGPALMPHDVQGRARARQIMRLADAEVYKHLVWGVYVPWKDGKPLAGLDKADIILGELARLKLAEFLAGDGFSLADAYVFAMLKYFSMVPEGTGSLQKSPGLVAWMARVEQLESVSSTRFPIEVD